MGSKFCSSFPLYQSENLTHEMYIMMGVFSCVKWTERKLNTRIAGDSTERNLDPTKISCYMVTAGVTDNRYNNQQVQTALLLHWSLPPHYLLHVSHEFLYATVDITAVHQHHMFKVHDIRSIVLFSAVQHEIIKTDTGTGCIDTLVLVSPITSMKVESGLVLSIML